MGAPVDRITLKLSLIHIYFIDNTERSISFLLGDGAGAAVVGVSDEPGIAPTVWGSDGSRWGTVGMTH